MKTKPLAIPDVLLIEPKIFCDNRGLFFESYNQENFQNVSGLSPVFVQDNHSKSTKGVLRGLHYQLPPFAQDKLVRVVQGSVFDVAVDVRSKSATFGQWIGEVISAENKKQLWIPSGFAHGFLTISETAEVLYKTTEYYAPHHERCLYWNDSDIGINWPECGATVSKKDAQGILLHNAEVFD